jgi:hypothetical protein
MIVRQGNAGLRTTDLAFEGLYMDFLEGQFPRGFGGEAHVTYCNGEVVDPETYADVRVCGDDDWVLSFSPADPITALVVALVAGAVTLGLSLLLAPKVPGLNGGDDPQTVYSVTAQANRARIGGAIPVPYGRSVWTPDYAAQSYRYYENNQEVRIFLLCVGQGDIDVRGLRVGETQAQDLPDGLIRHQVFKPAQHRRQMGVIGRAFGVSENVVTSGDVERQQLDGRIKFDGEDVRGVLRGFTIEFDDESVAAQAAPGDTIRLLKSRANGLYTVQSVRNNVVTLDRRVRDGSRSDKFDMTITGGPSLSVGPFVSSPPGSRAQRVELDIEFPQGLHDRDDDGDIRNIGVRLEASLQQIDDDGDPLGEPLLFDTEIEGATRTPQRRTWSIDGLPAGRFSISLRRTNGESLENQADQTVWTGLKAYLVNDTAAKIYGDVTILAVEIRGGEELSGRSQNRIFAETETLIETLAGGPKRFSNNPADIMADVILNSTYGAARGRSGLELESLGRFFGSQSGRSGFNGVFDRSITVWEALTDIALVGRASPHPVGALLGVVEDGEKPVRASIVTPDLILKDTFALRSQWRSPGSHDGYVVEFSDPDTFATRTAVYPLGAARPKKAEIRGLANFDEALDLAKWFWLQEQERSISLNWEMEWDALNFARFDRVGVAFPLFDWGRAGLVHSWHGRTIHLDRDGVPEGPIYCVLRDPCGKSSQVLVAQGDGVRMIVFDQDLPFEPMHGGQGQATPVAFGVLEDFLRDVTIERVEPQGTSTRVEARLYAPDLYQSLLT